MGPLENIKEVADLIKKAGDIELYRKIAESEGEVIELTYANRWRLRSGCATIDRHQFIQGMGPRRSGWAEGECR